MPHENINSSIDGGFRVQVIWKPQAHLTSAYDEPEPGYVQIMTENPESEARFPSPEVITEPGATPNDPPTHRAGNPTWSEPCKGFAMTATREDINRLIRMLRRARDSAFGSDA